MRASMKWAALAAVGIAGAAGAVALAGTTADASAEPPVVTVYKSPTCGCCSKWVDHLRAAGFTVEAVDVADLSEVKTLNGITRNLASCHTAIVDGYVVEGHVPATEVERLLEERPDVAGLAVPGMPIGSPGMEGPNPQNYEVLAFDRNGGVRVWSRH